jgi:regulator of sigma E protease
METFIVTAAAFIVAIGVLVAVHEFGHFWVARRLGVKVLRFSIGFGRPLWRRQSSPDDPEYVIAAIPLGGYVKMLDEREEPVPPDQVHLAFNRQSLWRRSAIVIAGPAFNFLFAILAFWLVLTLGETGMRPIIGEVDAQTPAERAGLEAGDEILSVNGQRTPTWALALQEVATASIGDPELRILVRDADGIEGERVMPSSEIGDMAGSSDLLGRLGLRAALPPVPAVIGRVLPDEPAAAAGMEPGDRVLSADDTAIGNWADWVRYVQARPGEQITVVVERSGERLSLAITPAPHAAGEEVVGRIGAANEPAPEVAQQYQGVHSLGLFEAVPAAAARTWEYSVLTLKVIWRIVTGQASIHNLSGPITIADAAGKTASIGLVYFLKFLAIVSISLGVLNLLPIPVLDGGHLLYFAIEAVKGSPVSEAAMIQGQKVGLLLILGLMSVAFYVDIHRLIS